MKKILLSLCLLNLFAMQVNASSAEADSMGKSTTALVVYKEWDNIVRVPMNSFAMVGEKSLIYSDGFSGCLGVICVGKNKDSNEKKIMIGHYKPGQGTVAFNEFLKSLQLLLENHSIEKLVCFNSFVNSDQYEEALDGVALQHPFARDLLGMMSRVEGVCKVKPVIINYFHFATKMDLSGVHSIQKYGIFARVKDNKIVCCSYLDGLLERNASKVMEAASSEINRLFLEDCNATRFSGMIFCLSSGISDKLKAGLLPLVSDTSGYLEGDQGIKYQIYMEWMHDEFFTEKCNGQLFKEI